MEIRNFFKDEKNKLGKDISIYVCGPTVYGDPHIGNMRPIVVFDIFNKVASLKGSVNFTHNITDIDDKIINKAAQEEVSEKEISEKYTKKYMDLLNQLNINKPTHMPKVSENIDGMIKFIEMLIEKDFAYVSKGNVYFSISKDKSYGKIANLSIEEHETHNELDENKIDPQDFALWKNTQKGITFDSPWGKGRPGWHTECAYFIKDIYGDEGIDIHGGGIDLRFPHHVNEMVQYKAITNNELASNWVYVGHVQNNSEKMSKSLENFWTAEDFINKYSANILRVLLSSKSILKPIDLNDDVISNAVEIISKIENTVKSFVLKYKFAEEKEDSEMIKILSNDIDLSAGFTHLFEILKEVNTGNTEAFQKLLFDLNILGIKLEIDHKKLLEYKDAYSKGNFELSDILRKEIVKI